MRIKSEFKLQNINDFKRKLFNYFSECKHVVFLDSNDYPNKDERNKKYSDFDFIFARGAHKIISPENDRFGSLQKELASQKDWAFGILSYDLKNETEKLYSQNTDELNFPEILFFIPKMILFGKGNRLTVKYLSEYYSKEQVKLIVDDIGKQKIRTGYAAKKTVKLKHRFSKNQYLTSVKKLKQHIQRGDIYEANFCTEFYSENTPFNPHSTFTELNEISPTPFAGYFRIQDAHLICAGPERFIKKSANKIISQPIKGTIARGKSKPEDTGNAKRLKNDIKERAENVMIVDLVRNDLSRTAAKSTVEVEELFGIYKFPQVFQMISTIVSEKKATINGVEVIKAAFPPGSMTGAPKIRAMELIEDYEKTKRSWYAGSLGYFTPEGDFDFNVIIRSMLYNAENNYLSFTVGGAITDKSVPEKEYEECLLKAEAILKVLGNSKS